MDIARHWRQRATRYRLEGQRHRHSGVVRFPPQPPALGEEADVWAPAPLSAAASSTASVCCGSPAGHESFGIYAVGMVRLEEGPLVTAQLTDCAEEDLAIGMPVEMVTRRLADTGEDGVLVYGYKFRPRLLERIGSE